MRHRPYLHIRIQHVEREPHGDNRNGDFVVVGAAEEAEGMDEGAVDVVEEEEGEGEERERVGGFAAGGEEGEGEEESWGFHYEPGEGRGEGTAPVGAGVLAVWRGDEEERDEGEGEGDVQGEEGGGEEGFLCEWDHGGNPNFGCGESECGW